jgi:hypothetical protein
VPVAAYVVTDVPLAHTALGGVAHVAPQFTAREAPHASCTFFVPQLPAPQFAAVSAASLSGAQASAPASAKPDASATTVASAGPASTGPASSTAAPASASVTTIVAVGLVPASGDPTLENSPHGG